ncbi:MAG: hypothetical protein A3C90_00180 [Candidatus Magasanikbacteria bacterium RIFCSPHIGHO2_02_FULL_51_14]|uniref:UDP-N-acetylglucosamine 2-epimerase domain-containing protein n=1 Tax=Candidatus Magasanikbacteria bacterium RIFCSPHIGHO2_02_FULL_51_14 TaxID=1798683 RepID=A0A1F6MCZ2_9BACT|nr:MAG: hypothetical protein A3C90_00180 [Candidatus Magasanikbacteria bacterium RIFCSPHIGHO2_02_FULL_51_14]
MGKTVFIVITRGFIIRNILRSGVLDYLKQSGCKVIIFLQTMKENDVPEYLKKEFQDERVTIVGIGDYLMNNFFDRLYRFFAKWTIFLVYSKSTLHYIRFKNIKKERMFFWMYIEIFFLFLFSKLHVLKKIVRLIERKVFVSNFYAKYFDAYRPDVIFSTSIISGIDMAFMKEAQRRGVKTISMTKGWDHAARSFYRFVPDNIIVQNAIMKDYLFKYQKIKKEKVKVGGFPQFDWYVHGDLLVRREEFLSSLGLDPQRKLILFGSEGPWSPEDDNIVGLLAKYIAAGRFPTAASLLIRPHYVDLKTERYDKFIGLKNIKLDASMVYHETLSTNWDPDMREIAYFVNLMHHMDLLINMASTLTLDACCFDKPVIAVSFGVLHDEKSGKDLSGLLYEADHFQDVLKTGAVDLVHSEQELLESVNMYLLHPERKREERKTLLNTLCYKVDGNSAKRVADEILSLL